MRSYAVYWFVILVLSLSGCAQTVKHQPLSKDTYEALKVADSVANERWWGDAAPPDLVSKTIEYRKIFKQHARTKQKGKTKVLSQNILALSGGGANGAFGAGLLAGWTESGKRPTFDIVTGSSTGALIAPFAFLGSAYDETISDLYATATRDSIYTPKILSGLISGSALSDTSSLKKQIETHITPALINEIAKEYKKGRRLFVMTTHFDAMRPMFWDIGYIANHRKADGVDLIRKVILASTSVPVLFPPVPIEWETNGEKFTELHVDGGVTRSVFAYPSQLNVSVLDKQDDIKLDRKIYVVINGNSALGYAPAPVDVLGIAERTINGLLQHQTHADIERIYHLAKRDGVDFNIIEIPDSFNADGATAFDSDYMNALLGIGKEIAKKNNFWYKKPPTLRQ